MIFFMWVLMAICYAAALVAIGAALAAHSIAIETREELRRAEGRSWYPRLYHGNTEAADEALGN